jgi:hypothetical protein
MKRIGPDVAEARARVASRRGLPPLGGRAQLQLRSGEGIRVGQPALWKRADPFKRARAPR